jgi:hypothetical protein
MSQNRLAKNNCFQRRKTPKMFSKNAGLASCDRDEPASITGAYKISAHQSPQTGRFYLWSDCSHDRERAFDFLGSGHLTSPNAGRPHIPFGESAVAPGSVPGAQTTVLPREVANFSRQTRYKSFCNFTLELWFTA